MGLEERVQELEDERAILRTLSSYGHALDYGLEDMWVDCWTGEAVLRWPERPPIVGHAELIEAFRAHTHAPDRYHKHFVVDPLISLDGDSARATSLFARLDSYPDGPALKSFGRYIDRLVRCADGRWRITERVAEREAGRPPAAGA